MHTSSNVHSVLNKLISLTGERDVATLEQSLTQALYDLITPTDGNGTQSVTIYHVNDAKQQLFPAATVGNGSGIENLSAQQKQMITECFNYADCGDCGKSGCCSNLYPLKNSNDRTIAVMAIEAQAYAQIDDPQLRKTITMLLHIYQNFTGLINDNERDTLTGLLNRKTFEYKINKVLTQMHKTTKRKDDRPNQVHFLAMFDIDHFKNVNDVFGHQIGDEVLLMFSQLMTQTYRDKDLLFRFGGEEFVGVFECASADDIQSTLDRFREKIGNFDFPQVGKVTVSSGYTEISADNSSSQLIDRADLALYYAKNNGRNRVCYYEQLITDGALQESKVEGEVELF